jgi:CheY-like chemotaxis protein
VLPEINVSVQRHVLIVDDDASNQMTLSALVRQLGHRTSTADDGEQALRLVETANDVDLVISDVLMPGMGGIAFARRARATRPALPVILVTGDADAVDLVLAHGAVALLKPYSRASLRDVVDEALARDQSARPSV